MNCIFVGNGYFEEKQPRHYTREKRQADLDPSAKHVEILVAYDDSLKDFHSDIEVRSYILTLFKYVSRKCWNLMLMDYVWRRFHICIPMRVLEIISRFGW